MNVIEIAALVLALPARRRARVLALVGASRRSRRDVNVAFEPRARFVAAVRADGRA